MEVEGRERLSVGKLKYRIVIIEKKYVEYVETTLKSAWMHIIDYQLSSSG